MRTLAFCLSLLFFSTLVSYSQITVLPDGKVGLGNNNNTPGCAVDILGNTAIRPSSTGNYVKFSSDDYYGWIMNSSSPYTGYIGYYGYLFSLDAKFVYCTNLTGSDLRLKKNIQPLASSLAIIQRLRPVSFDYTNDYSMVKNEKLRTELEKSDLNQLGFIAQEVQELLPQTVKMRESDSMLCINYTEFIPLLVKGMQEQSELIGSLKNELAALTSKKSMLKSGVSTGMEETEIAALEQNSPNPFTETTLIKCYLPPTVREAQLMICDMKGSFVKSIQVYDRGNVSTQVNGKELGPGIFFYTLIIDNAVADTRKMILTTGK
jgi:hypothetical protein